MNKLQLKHRELKIISVITASENINHAATIFGITQANVSKYLADFGSKVGLEVFDRTTRQLTLTPFGTALLPYINDTLGRNEQLNNFIANYKREKCGKVTVYAPTGVIAYLSQHVIAKIMDVGDISLVLETYDLDCKAFYEDIDFPDDCDILLSYAHPRDEPLVTSFITKYAVIAFASREYLTKNPISSPDELVNHSCILVDSMMIDDANIWWFNSAEDKRMRDHRVTGNYICNNTQSTLALVRGHLGTVFAPNGGVQKDCRSEMLVSCFSEQHEWWLDLVAIFRKREHQPWRVQYILDAMLAEICQQLVQAIRQPE